MNLLPCGQIPDTKCVIVRARDRLLPFLRDGDGIHKVRMAGQCKDFETGIQIPYLECLVEGSRDRLSAILCYRHSVDLISVASQSMEQGAGLQVPDLKGPVRRRGNTSAPIFGDG